MSSTNVQKSSDNKAGSADHSNDRSADRTSVGADYAVQTGGKPRLPLFDASLIGPAIADSFRKLSPRTQLRSPVMFVVYVGSVMTSLLFLQSLFGQGKPVPDSFWPFPYGYGSPSCSPILLSRWQRGAAKHRRHHYGR
jgi:K+-transporting ATPase ATPase B chain